MPGQNAIDGLVARSDHDDCSLPTHGNFSPNYANSHVDWSQ